jgi:drug/metabolite transporter (DMT)-like permease
MIPALLTTVLWSFCVVAARRSVAHLGENVANLARLAVAVLSLGLIAHLLGGGLAGVGFWLFFCSGLVGFGIGDIGGFFALPRIGSRLTVLLAQCGAAPLAGLIEWWWLGTVVSGVQCAAVALILGGICLALAPNRKLPAASPRFWIGVGCGLVAAFGQGFGAVLSRKAYLHAAAMGEPLAVATIGEAMATGATTGYQRLLGGILLVALFTLGSRHIRILRTRPDPLEQLKPWTVKAFWVGANALTGPVLGIIFFQWALATTPSFIVQPIVAMTPLVVIPFAWWIEGDRPTGRFIAGALVAVGGVSALALAG